MVELLLELNGKGKKLSIKAVPPDNPKKIKVDKWFTHRGERYEVEPMITKVAKKLGKSSKAARLKIRIMITTKLPGKIRGKKKVFDWLVENYPKFSKLLDKK